MLSAGHNLCFCLLFCGLAGGQLHACMMSGQHHVSMEVCEPVQPDTEIDWAQLPLELQVLVSCAAVGSGTTRNVCRAFRDTVDAATQQLHVPVPPQPIQSLPQPPPASSTQPSGSQPASKPGMHPLQLRLGRFPRLQNLSVALPGQGRRLLLDLSDCPPGLHQLSVIGDRYHQHSMRNLPHLPALHTLVLKNVLVAEPDAAPSMTDGTQAAEAMGSMPHSAIQSTEQQPQDAQPASAPTAGASAPRRFARRGRTAAAVQLDLSAAPQCRRITCWSRSITAFDLRPVTHLTELDVREINLTELDLQFTPHLTKLICMDTSISHLDLSHTPHLEHLNIHATDVRDLDLRPCAHSLKRLRASNCAGLSQLALEGLSQLEFLDVAGTGITQLDWRQVPKLTTLDCGLSQVSHIELAALPSLTALQCSDSQVSYLELSHVPHLRALFASALVGLTELDVTACPDLETVRIAQSAVARLQLGYVPRLKRLDVSGTPISGLDLWDARQLQQLYAADTLGLHLDDPFTFPAGLEVTAPGVFEMPLARLQQQQQQQGNSCAATPASGPGATSATTSAAAGDDMQAEPASEPGAAGSHAAGPEAVGFEGLLLKPWQWSWLHGLVLDMDIRDALAALDDPHVNY